MNVNNTMKRRATKQKPKKGFLRVLSIVLVFSLLVFFGASGFSGRFAHEEEYPEEIYATCTGNDNVQQQLVAGIMQEAGPEKVGSDLATEVTAPRSANLEECKALCYQVIMEQQPIGATVVYLSCEGQQNRVLSGCETACFEAKLPY